MSDATREMADVAARLDRRAVRGRHRGGRASSGRAAVREAIAAAPVDPAEMQKLGADRRRAAQLDEAGRRSERRARSWSSTSDYAGVDPREVGFAPVATLRARLRQRQRGRRRGRTTRRPARPCWRRRPWARRSRTPPRIPTIDAIVFRIDSPGGSALASDLVWHAIERARASGQAGDRLVLRRRGLGRLLRGGGRRRDRRVARRASPARSACSCCDPCSAGVLEKLGIGFESLDARPARRPSALARARSRPASPRAAARRGGADLRPASSSASPAGRTLDRDRVDAVGAGPRLDRRAGARSAASSTSSAGCARRVREGKRRLDLAEDADVALVSYPAAAARSRADRRGARAALRARAARPRCRCADALRRAQPLARGARERRSRGAAAVRDRDPRSRSRARIGRRCAAGGLPMHLEKQFDVKRPRGDGRRDRGARRDAARAVPGHEDRDRRERGQPPHHAHPLHRARPRGHRHLPLHLPRRRRRRLREGLRRQRLARAQGARSRSARAATQHARAHRDGRPHQGARARVHHQGRDARPDRADGGGAARAARGGLSGDRPGRDRRRHRRVRRGARQRRADRALVRAGHHRRELAAAGRAARRGGPARRAVGLPRARALGRAGRPRRLHARARGRRSRARARLGGARRAGDRAAGSRSAGWPRCTSRCARPSACARCCWSTPGPASRTRRRRRAGRRWSSAPRRSSRRAACAPSSTGRAAATAGRACTRSGRAARAAADAIAAQAPHGIAHFARRVAGPAPPVIDQLGEHRARPRWWWWARRTTPTCARPRCWRRGCRRRERVVIPARGPHREPRRAARRSTPRCCGFLRDARAGSAERQATEGPPEGSGTRGRATPRNPSAGSGFRHGGGARARTRRGRTAHAGVPRGRRGGLRRALPALGEAAAALPRAHAARRRRGGGAGAGGLPACAPSARERYQPDARFSTLALPDRDEPRAQRAAAAAPAQPARERRRATTTPLPRGRASAADEVVDARRDVAPWSARCAALPERQRAALLAGASRAARTPRWPAALETSEQAVKALVHRARVQPGRAARAGGRGTDRRRRDGVRPDRAAASTRRTGPRCSTASCRPRARPSCASTSRGCARCRARLASLRAGGRRCSPARACQRCPRICARGSGAHRRRTRARCACRSRARSARVASRRRRRRRAARRGRARGGGRAGALSRVHVRARRWRPPGAAA